MSSGVFMEWSNATIAEAFVQYNTKGWANSLQPIHLRRRESDKQGQSSQGGWPFAFGKGLAPLSAVVPVPILAVPSPKLKRPSY